MTDRILLKKSAAFALEVIKYYQWLCSEKKEYVMSKQLLRSGTSIGANINEAYYAVSTADFINKMQIAVKEAAESEYWFYLLEESGYFSAEFSTAKSLLNEVKRMLVSTLKTAKNKN